jgi:hypothetical protein
MTGKLTLVSPGGIDIKNNADTKNVRAIALRGRNYDPKYQKDLALTLVAKYSDLTVWPVGFGPLDWPDANIVDRWPYITFTAFNSAVTTVMPGSINGTTQFELSKYGRIFSPSIVRMNIYDRKIFIIPEINNILTVNHEVVEGNGVDPIVYTVNPNKYRDYGPYVNPNNFIFNLYDNPGPADPTRAKIGTMENLPPGATLVLDPMSGDYILTVYPTNGVYPDIYLYYALKSTDEYVISTSYPPIIDTTNPDYWYFGDI